MVRIQTNLNLCHWQNLDTSPWQLTRDILSWGGLDLAPRGWWWRRRGWSIWGSTRRLRPFDSGGRTAQGLVAWHWSTDWLGEVVGKVRKEARRPGIWSVAQFRVFLSSIFKPLASFNHAFFDNTGNWMFRSLEQNVKIPARKYKILHTIVPDIFLLVHQFLALSLVKMFKNNTEPCLNSVKNWLNGESKLELL